MHTRPSGYATKTTKTSSEQGCKDAMRTPPSAHDTTTSVQRAMRLQCPLLMTQIS